MNAVTTAVDAMNAELLVTKMPISGMHPGTMLTIPSVVQSVMVGWLAQQERGRVVLLSTFSQSIGLSAPQHWSCNNKTRTVHAVGHALTCRASFFVNMIPTDPCLHAVHRALHRGVVVVRRHAGGHAVAESLAEAVLQDERGEADAQLE